MATRVYANSADYAEFTGAVAPPNVDYLLRVGSRIVDVLLRGVVYDTDAAGMPTDADDAEALRDATCTIAAECETTGVLSAGGTQAWDSVGIGSVSLSGKGTAADTVLVQGIPVPGSAVLALSTVGPVVVIQR